MKKVKLISTLVVSVFVLSLFAPAVLAVDTGEGNSSEPVATSTPAVTAQNIAGSVEDSLVQLRKDKEDFKNNKQLEESEIAKAAKEKVAAKRKLIEAKKEELRINKEEKRKTVLIRLLDIQIKQLKNTKERVAKMPNIKEDLKTSLNTKIDSAIAELNAEKTKVQNATASDDLKKLGKEIKDLFKSKREIVKAIVDAILASVADKNITTAENRLTELTAKIAELKAAGQDTTALDNLLTIAKGKIAAANTKIGKKDLKEAVNDLKEAYKYMKSITEKTDSVE